MFSENIADENFKHCPWFSQPLPVVWRKYGQRFFVLDSFAIEAEKEIIDILRPQLLQAVASDLEMLLSHCLLSFFFLDMLSYQPLAKISTITYICTILYRDSRKKNSGKKHDHII